MATSVVVCHSRARQRAGERNTVDHTGGKIGARAGGNVDDGVVNIAAHDVDVAVGLKGVSVGIGAGWGRL